MSQSSQDNQTKNSNMLIKQFIANIIDIYDEEAINIFVVDGKLNIDIIINHHLTKLSVLYQVIYNHLYGTWATKKDFMLFCNDVLNVKKNYKNFHVTIDVNLVNAILAHYPFFIARIGAVHKLNTLQDLVTTTITRLNETSSSATFMCDIIQQKWKYRYNVMDFEKMFVSNILKTFIKYQINNIVSCLEDSKVWNNVSGFQSDHKELYSRDYEYLNKYEVIQYHLHCDNRFLLQLASYVVIVKDNNEYRDNDLLNLVKSIQQHSKKHAILLSVGVDKTENVRFSYKIESDLYFILPKISTKFYLMSNDKLLSQKRLCTIPTECMLITHNPVDITPEQKAMFGIVLTSSVDKISQQQSIYHFPCSIDVCSSRYSELIKEVQLALWKEYNNMKCPFQSQNSRHSGVLFTNFISLYLQKNIVNIEKTFEGYVNDNNANVSIVAVDNRYNVMTLLSVIVSLYNVIRHKQTRNFNGIVYTSRQSIGKYEDLIAKLGLSSLILVRVIEMFDDVDLFHMEVYNQVLKSVDFWNTLECEKCIIVQDDGFLMNGKYLDDYLKYDYVGAPWADAKDNEYIKKHINPGLTGNGGFSIRDVGVSKHICETFTDEKNKLFYHNLNEIPEDVYFVKHLVSSGANVAPFDVARKFAVEQVLSVGCQGFHKFWIYHPPIESIKIFDSFLEQE
jgi:Protein of unknown function (DUF5672)